MRPKDEKLYTRWKKLNSKLLQELRKLLEVAFPDTKFTIEIYEKPVVRWKNGPELEDVYKAAALIGINRSEFICFQIQDSG